MRQTKKGGGHRGAERKHENGGRGRGNRHDSWRGQRGRGGPSRAQSHPNQHTRGQAEKLKPSRGGVDRKARFGVPDGSATSGTAQGEPTSTADHYALVSVVPRPLLILYRSPS